MMGHSAANLVARFRPSVNFTSPLRTIYTTFKTTKDQSQGRFGHVPNIRINRGKYTVKMVASKTEYLEVLKLRYEVFHREYRNKRFPFGIDVDSYDSTADYLIVRDDEARRIVGAYRIISSRRSKNFYSASEFDISKFVAEPGIKAELSRACIQRAHRNGLVLTLLWRGLNEYLNVTGTRYLFGIPSIKTTNPAEAALVATHFRRQGISSDNWGIQPIGEYRMADFDKEMAKHEGKETPALAKEVEELIPPLLKSYIKAGSKVIGLPALDRAFNCVDYFTVLDLDQMGDVYKRKYRTDA
jgi:putative hemolysin